MPFRWVTVRPEVVYIRRSGSVQIHPDRTPISVRARIGSNSNYFCSISIIMFKTS